MSTGIPYLGSKISLINKSEIRYEGILYTIDTQMSTVALAQVRSFGTEDRPTDRPVAPRDEVYEYIIFRGADVKDIRLCEPPKPQSTLPGGLPNDQAIKVVSFGDPGKFSDSAEKQLDKKMSNSKYLKNEKDELEKKLLNKREELFIHRKTSSKLIQDKSANLMDLTEQLRNCKIKKEDNKHDVEEVDQQLKTLRLKKEGLLDKQSFIDNNINRLERYREIVKSHMENATAASELKETKLSIELETLEEEMKSVDENKKDGKDYTAPVSRKPPCLECPVCLEDMKPPTNIIQCEGGEHYICEKCSKKPGVEICPTCKAQFMGRAKGMERFMRQLYGCE